MPGSTAEGKDGGGNAKAGHALAKSERPSEARISETYNIIKEAIMRTEDGADVDNKFCPAFMNLLHKWHDMLPHVLNFREEMKKQLNGITPSSTGKYSLLHHCAAYGKAEAVSRHRRPAW